jgi:hypothetical protein
MIIINHYSPWLKLVKKNRRSISPDLRSRRSRVRGLETTAAKIYGMFHRWEELIIYNMMIIVI